jgi:hypothetical protein
MLRHRRNLSRIKETIIELTSKDRKKEIGAGLLHAMCKDLGIDPREL